MPSYVITEDDFRDLVLDDLQDIRRAVYGVADFLFLLLLMALAWVYRAEIAAFFARLPGVGDG